jgi:2-polyprenyl-6-hydroxyphenyl methylase/3-demethylubiquinone-9 3-methyltransferase
MHPGAFVRRLFGPYERHISDAYRSIYIDLDALVERVRVWQPGASRILEVGCGEGAVTERLRAAYPGADITAIDVSPRVGRLYRGSRENVRFLQSSVEEIAAPGAGTYDLVVLCDVLHHVPPASRTGLLDGIRAALAPGGTFVFKDWERNRAPIHWLCHASDRWLTGDRVRFLTSEQMREELSGRFGAGAVIAETWVRPWRNNVAFLVRPNPG